jgi:hypothetical protein
VRTAFFPLVTMMRMILFFTSILVPFSLAFAPKAQLHRTKTSIEAISRRDALLSGASALIIGIGSLPQPSMAFSQQLDEREIEPSQMPTDGKFDLNNSFIGEYKQLRGMFPHAAGKIASNGPYKQVADIYKIPDLTENDKKLFKKYEKEFTVNPPGRAFNERINARVST